MTYQSIEKYFFNKVHIKTIKYFENYSRKLETTV